MFVSCKCLNISLQLPSSLSRNAVMAATQCANKNELSKCTADEVDGKFFEKALGPLKLSLIEDKPLQCTTNVEEFLTIVTIDKWLLYKCRYCMAIPCAQTSNDDGTEFLLNADQLMSSEGGDLKFAKTMPTYSAAFGILCNRNAEKDIRNSTDSNIDHGKYAKLTKRFRESVQAEIAATDERIRQYTSDQYTQLRDYRERVEMDYRLLFNALQELPDETEVNRAISVDSSTNAKYVLDTPPATPDSTPMSIGNSPVYKQQSQPATIDSIVPRTGVLSLVRQHQQPQVDLRSKNIVQNATTTTSLSQQNFDTIDEALDASFFFEIEHMADQQAGISIQYNASSNMSTAMSDVEESESDNDENEEEAAAVGVIIGRQSWRPKSLCVAHSLPISIPLPSELHSPEDDNYNEGQYENNAEDNVDIAASIKALAKSVHGEALFGDLPRPRFSNQI